jgi:hypothetical protein
VKDERLLRVVHDQRLGARLEAVVGAVETVLNGEIAHRLMSGRKNVEGMDQDNNHKQ